MTSRPSLIYIEHAFQLRLIVETIRNDKYNSYIMMGLLHVEYEEDDR